MTFIKNIYTKKQQLTYLTTITQLTATNSYMKVTNMITRVVFIWSAIERRTHQNTKNKREKSYWNLKNITRKEI